MCANASLNHQPITYNAYEHLPLPYQALDQKGQIININAAWMHMFGYKRRATVIGRSFTDFLQPDALQSFHQCFKRMRTGEKVDGEVLPLKGRSGKFICGNFSGQAELDHTGKIAQIHCIVKDYSHKKKEEDR